MERKPNEENLSKDQREKCQLTDLNLLLIKEWITILMNKEKKSI